MANPEDNNPDASTQPDGSDASNNPDVDYEKRFKDTQGAFTKSQQENKKLLAKMEILEKLTKPQVELDEVAKSELESLKFSDPDAWRAKLNTLEKEARAKHRANLTEAERVVNQQSELEIRSQQLANFNRSHPNLVINNDVIKYDVPPRITSKLERGEINFDQFLNEVGTFLGSPKVVGDGNKTLNQPNLKAVGGDNTPTDSAVKGDIVTNYANAVF